ncbi:SDR family oxidoreductase [Candidatus Roizmanbacteria bacterium]|nr:SDR family oxidoreductase [Candidatus Roizmanbacteria bacterium]
MTILITGGAGFIGSHLTQLHLERGDDVYVIDNLITGSLRNLETVANHPHFQCINADITQYDFSSLPSFDTIYHLASPASPIQYKKYPVETLLCNSFGTYRLLEFMKSSGSKRFLFTSTSEIYGDPLVHPQPESYWGNVNTLGPRACYDESKRFGEAICSTYVRKYNLDVRMARLFNTYGPNMEKNDGRVVSNFIVQALEQKPITIYGDGTQTRSFCYVSDTVDGIYKLATTEGLKGEVINIGNPDERTMIELATIIKKITLSSSEIVFQELDADDPKKRKPDIAHAKAKLGWEPKVALSEGLTATISYFKTLI